jgi:regulator of cell morphogenesis and NO signaling
VDLIIDYLRNTHEYYLEIKVPEIQGHIDEMEENASSRQQKSIMHLNSFFREYTQELREHLSREDNSVFPYILALQEAHDSKDVSEELYREILKEPIRIYEKNHDNLEIKLSDLKNLIIKYLPPISSKDCRKLLIELFRLESDLENHSRIEEKVLIPKVGVIENEILEFYGTR